MRVHPYVFDKHIKFLLM